MGLTPEEWSAVRLSLAVAGRAVAVSLPLAVLAAVVLARGRFPGKALLDALVHLPLVMPPVVVITMSLSDRMWAVTGTYSEIFFRSASRLSSGSDMSVPVRVPETIALLTSSNCASR